eukprot:TRINITY_DN33241_c0_g1_i1.p1 TRINITY_DN33241_c0_g1~~TRINITY_DN33241_c0_g1_i1.p1  ORF type:complete len:181 (+),score=12.61 TRINITY_DN33241_c0_g1_i1:28-543(+)
MAYTPTSSAYLHTFNPGFLPISGLATAYPYGTHWTGSAFSMPPLLASPYFAAAPSVFNTPQFTTSYSYGTAPQVSGVMSAGLLSSTAQPAPWYAVPASPATASTDAAPAVPASPLSPLSPTSPRAPPPALQQHRRQALGQFQRPHHAPHNELQLPPRKSRAPAPVLRSRLK